MRYSELIEKSKQYEKESYGDEVYLECFVERKVWDNLDKITEDNVKNVVLYFLNKWKCRVPYKYTLQLYETLKKSDSLFKLLKEEVLENIIFDEKTVSTIKSIYNTLDLEGFHVRATAVSKIMHMVIPELFVMWEEKIIENYGYSPNATGYVKFLKEMQREANEVIEDYSKTNDVSISKAKEKICKIKSLPKLIDEYNYMNR